MTGWVGRPGGRDSRIPMCTKPPESENRARVSGLQPDSESRIWTVLVVADNRARAQLSARPTEGTSGRPEVADVATRSASRARACAAWRPLLPRRRRRTRAAVPSTPARAVCGDLGSV